MVARLAAALFALVVAVGVPTPAAAQEAPAGPTREVVDLAYRELGDDDNMLAWTTLTEVAFFGVEAGPDGRLVDRDPAGRAGRRRR